MSTAVSGEDALTTLHRQDFDRLVLDMIMPPGWDGLETFRAIRQHNPRQRAIIASGYSETARVHEMQRLGAGSYVKKPLYPRKNRPGGPR